MAIGIYAGDSASAVVELPSPVEVTPSMELIWSENTGRAQSGSNRAKMIGDVVAEKNAYNIKWGILEASDFTAITTHLKAGFFYFAVASSLASARAIATTYYRGNISYSLLSVGSETYYKDVTVDVIQQ